MGKAFAILLVVLGVWLGLEIFNNGTEGAFGGIFATGGESASSASAEPPAQRIRNRVQKSMKASEARTTSGIGDDDELDEVPADEDSGTDEYGSEE